MNKKLYKLYKLEEIKKERELTPREKKTYNEIISHFDSKGLNTWKFFQTENID